MNFIEIQEALAETRTADRELRVAVESAFNARVRAEQQRREPRRRKNFSDLPEDVITPWKEEALRDYRERAVPLKATEAELMRRLFTAAEAVIVQPLGTVMNRVSRAHEADFSSQPNKRGYAKGSLLPLAEALHGSGCMTQIVCRLKRLDYYPGCGNWVTHFELWADCQPWEAEAVRLRLTTEFQVRVWVKAGLNPWVFQPYLPTDIHERCGIDRFGNPLPQAERTSHETNVAGS